MKQLQLTDHEIIFSSRLRWRTIQSGAYRGNITSLDNLIKSQYTNQETLQPNLAVHYLYKPLNLLAEEKKKKKKTTWKFSGHFSS